MSGSAITLYLYAAAAGQVTSFNRVMYRRGDERGEQRIKVEYIES